MGTHKPTVAGARCPVAGCSHEKLLSPANRDGPESAAAGMIPDWLGAFVLGEGEMVPEEMTSGAGRELMAAFSIPVESGIWAAAFCIPVEGRAARRGGSGDDGVSIDDLAATPRALLLAPTRELAGTRRGVLVRHQMAPHNPGPWGEAAPRSACPGGDVLNVARAGLGEVSEVQAERLEMERGKSRVLVLVVLVEVSAAGRRAQAQEEHFEVAGLAEAVIRDAARHGNGNDFTVRFWKTAVFVLFPASERPSTTAAWRGSSCLMLNRCPSGRDAMLGTVEDLIANSFHQLQYDKIKMGVIKEMVFGKPSRLIRSTIWLSYYTSLNLVISCTEGQFEAEHVIRNSFPLFFYEKGMPQMTQKITRLENEATLLYSSGELHRLGVFDTHVAARGCHVEMVGARNGMFDVGIEPQASISDATSRILKTHVQVSQDSDLDVLVKMRDNWTDWDLAVVVNLVKKPISCGTLLPALSAFRSTNYIVDTVLHCSSSHVALSEIVQKITRLENEATLLKSAEEGKVRDVNVMKNSQASGIVLPALSASHCDNYIVDTLIQCSSDFSKKGSRSKGCPPQSGEKVKMHVVSRGWTRPCVLLASIIMMLLLVSAESIPDGVCPVNRITSIVDETCPLHQYEPKRLIATSEYWIDEYVDTELFQCKKPVLPDQSWIQQIDILLQRDDYAETKKEHIIDIAETKNEQTDHCPIKSWQDVIISLIGLLSNVVTNLGPLIICCQIGNLNDKQRQLLVGSTFSFLAAHCFWISYLSGQDCVDLWKCVSSGVAIALNVGYQIFFWIKIRKMNPKSLIGSLACMAIIIVASALTGKFQVIAAGILGVIFNAFAHIMRFLASGREWNGMAFTIACSGVLSSSLFWHKVDWAVEVCYKIGCLTSLFFRGVDAILLLYYLWEHCTEKRLPMVNNDGGHKKNRHVPNQFTQPQASVANVQATSMDVAPRGSSSVPPRRGIQDEQLDPQALAPHALPPTVPAPRPADSTTPKPPDSTPPKAPAAAVDHKSDTTNDPKTSDAVDPKPAAAADLKSSDPTDAKPAIAAPDAKPASLADRDSSDVTGAKPAEPEAGGRR